MSCFLISEEKSFSHYGRRKKAKKQHMDFMGFLLQQGMTFAQLIDLCSSGVLSIEVLSFVFFHQAKACRFFVCVWPLFIRIMHALCSCCSSFFNVYLGCCLRSISFLLTFSWPYSLFKNCISPHFFCFFCLHCDQHSKLETPSKPRKVSIDVCSGLFFFF